MSLRPSGLKVVKLRIFGRGCLKDLGRFSEQCKMPTVSGSDWVTYPLNCLHKRGFALIPPRDIRLTLFRVTTDRGENIIQIQRGSGADIETTGVETFIWKKNKSNLVTSWGLLRILSWLLGTRSKIPLVFYSQGRRCRVRGSPCYSPSLPPATFPSAERT